MIPLDALDPTIEKPAYAKALLRETEFQAFQQLEQKERLALLQELLTKPISRFTVINELYFRSKWADCVKALVKEKRCVTLLEVASGDADLIPQMLARVFPGSTYITANMNRILNHSLLKKTAGLPLNMKLVDDDAANLLKHMNLESADLVAFQHGVNDVLQAILCGQHGVDTVYADWMELLPEMIRLLQQEINAGTFEAHVKQPFLSLLSTLLQVLKKNGVIAIHHYLFQLDLDWGYPPTLFEQMVPMVREWVKNLPGCEEIMLGGFEPQWWLFLRKKAAD
ncbi:MAG: hypothetical protein HFE39_04315 [Clostridiales bacterium]|jgi:hypothetical protein|nr:hypothetical protein [Clostridiales bacterium]